MIQPIDSTVETAGVRGVTSPTRANIELSSGNAVRPLTDSLNDATTTDLPEHSTDATLSVNAEANAELESLIYRLQVDKAVSSVCAAADGLGLQSGIAALSVSGFTGAIMGRLDAARTGSGGSAPTRSDGGSGGNAGMMSLGAVEKATPAPPPGTVGPLTVYASGTALGGDSSDMPGAAGFSYGASSGMIGVEVSASRHLILGAAASFTRLDTDLNTGATADADVIHGAAYLSYATRQWFVDALAAYGTVALDMARQGANETVYADTDAAALGLAARTGYLFEVGRLRVGPITGLSYVRATVDGYTEAGNDPTAVTVGTQTIDSLTGSAGIRFLAPFQANGMVLVPYLNVTLEHRFSSDTGSVTTTLTQAPGSPVALSFPTFGARDYGKVEGGLTAELAPTTSVSLSGASTFARDDGHDYRLSAGLSYRF